MNKVLVYKTNLLSYSETFIKEQVLSLSRWQAVLVGVNRSARGLDLSGIEVRLLGDLKASAWQRLRWKLARRLGLPPPGVVERLAAERAQLLHIHFGTEAAELWPVADALGIPVVVTLHGFDINTRREWWEQGKGGRWMRSYPRRLLEMAQSGRVSFIAVSEAIRQSAINFGLPAAKVIVRHIGIDVSRFTPGPMPVDQRPPRVLFTGRLVEKKGVEYLLRAFAKVRSALPAAQLVIAGDGPLRSSLEALSEELGCGAEFLGSISVAQVKEQMDAARVFCLPSVTAASGDAEGFGMVILEAQACGVPVVSSARGGAQEGLVHDATGFAHAERDIDALAAGVLRLLTNDDLARDFSTAARRYVEHHFDIRYCSRALESTYDELIRGTAGPNTP